MASVYTVAQVNTYIKNMFEQDYLLKQICVKGEVSNCKYHSSGHIYFTLKDNESAISCVMFAGNRQGLLFQLKDGLKVQVDGSIEAYVRDGKYQIYARRIIESGIGNLYERYEALKKKLSEEGLFDNQYKRPIPTFVRTLGVVTAPTGAAVRDIITVSKRRNPYLQIILYPAIVQGEAAPQSIVRGIQALEQYGVDVIIVGRGGGSIEDLWAFNEECVAQAIFQSEVPIISAVGHETDVTISDFVADLRAATPSAAAELAILKLSDTEMRISDLRHRLNVLMSRRIEFERQRFDQWNARLQAGKPTNRLKEQRMFAIGLEEKLQQLMRQKIQNERHISDIYAERLRSLSPKNRFKAGYAHVSSMTGQTITDIHMLQPNDDVCLTMRDGQIIANVSELIELNG